METCQWQLPCVLGSVLCILCRSAVQCESNHDTRCTIAFFFQFFFFSKFRIGQHFVCIGIGLIQVPGLFHRSSKGKAATIAEHAFHVGDEQLDRMIVANPNGSFRKANVPKDRWCRVENATYKYSSLYVN